MSILNNQDNLPEEHKIIIDGLRAVLGRKPTLLDFMKFCHPEDWQEMMKNVAPFLDLVKADILSEKEN